MENPLDYNGKVALVTGAGSGMGLVTANAFAEAGALAFFRNTLLSTYCHRNGDNVRVLRMILKTRHRRGVGGAVTEADEAESTRATDCVASGARTTARVRKIDCVFRRLNALCTSLFHCSRLTIY
jgi:NAD(P)-dependent dehydrogenase (short-subunit alcohol dehydrogenase family)